MLLIQAPTSVYYFFPSRLFALLRDLLHNLQNKIFGPGKTTPPCCKDWLLLHALPFFGGGVCAFRGVPEDLPTNSRKWNQNPSRFCKGKSFPKAFWGGGTPSKAEAPLRATSTGGVGRRAALRFYAGASPALAFPPSPLGSPFLPRWGAQGPAGLTCGGLLRPFSRAQQRPEQDPAGQKHDAQMPQPVLPGKGSREGHPQPAPRVEIPGLLR